MKIVKTDQAPQAIGPYSQAVIEGDFVFCSGQIGLSPTGEMANDLEGQVVQILENLKAVLVEAGSGLDKVVKTTIYLTGMDDFAAVNEIYARYFSGETKPARATVGVATLPKGARVEIDCIALI